MDGVSYRIAENYKSFLRIRHNTMCCFVLFCVFLFFFFEMQSVFCNSAPCWINATYKAPMFVECLFLDCDLDIGKLHSFKTRGDWKYSLFHLISCNYRECYTGELKLDTIRSLILLHFRRMPDKQPKRRKSEFKLSWKLVLLIDLQ